MAYSIDISYYKKGFNLSEISKIINVSLISLHPWRFKMPFWRQKINQQGYNGESQATFEYFTGIYIGTLIFQMIFNSSNFIIFAFMWGHSVYIYYE